MHYVLSNKVAYLLKIKIGKMMIYFYTAAAAANFAAFFAAFRFSFSSSS